MPNQAWRSSVTAVAPSGQPTVKMAGSRFYTAMMTVISPIACTEVQN